MEKLRTFIQSLSLQELDTLVDDVKKGSDQISAVLQEEILQRETANNKCCAHCGADIKHAYNRNFTITFGPTDFRKKATLCGLDCLDEFMSKMKSIYQMQQQEESNIEQ